MQLPTLTETQAEVKHHMERLHQEGRSTAEIFTHLVRDHTLADVQKVCDMFTKAAAGTSRGAMN